jgi:hypothetical protein
MNCRRRGVSEFRARRFNRGFRPVANKTGIADKRLPAYLTPSPPAARDAGYGCSPTGVPRAFTDPGSLVWHDCPPEQPRLCGAGTASRRGAAARSDFRARRSHQASDLHRHCTPGRRPDHLARLLDELLERIDPGLGIEAMRLVELNPDELVWSHMKRTGVARAPLRRGEKLRVKVEAQLSAIKRMPQLIRSFFQGAKCRLYCRLVSKRTACTIPALHVHRQVGTSTDGRRTVHSPKLCLRMGSPAREETRRVGETAKSVQKGPILD